MIRFTENTGKVHDFSDNTLLVFIDDTGHEELADKNFPVFGFGGCIVRAEDYPTMIKAWVSVANAFPSKMNPLHASDIEPKKLTDAQRKELSGFFSKTVFGRFAAIITKKTILNTNHEPLHLIAGLTYKRIVDIAKWFKFDKVVMIFEESKRTKLKVSDYFSRYNFEEDGQTIPTERFYATKKNKETGLIVADFVAHTAGTSVMTKLKGKVMKSIERKDFELVFASIDKKYASFIEVTEGHDS